MAAGKDVYCEKPTAATLAVAMDLVKAAKKYGVKHGVVQDKLFLPGLEKMKVLIDSGSFGKILSVRGEFGYWVFEEIGRAHVSTPVTNAHLVCRLLLDKKTHTI